jgi:GT2 family glycosyltransferase
MISFVIISAGVNQYLKNLIFFVFSDLPEDYEVILVCNSDECRHEFSNVKFVLNPIFKGYSHACNLGASVANGKFLVFLNDDIIFSLNAFRKSMNSMKNITTPFLAAPTMLNMNGTIQNSIYKGYLSNFSIRLSKAKYLFRLVNFFLLFLNLRLDFWGLRRVSDPPKKFAHAMGAFIVIDVTSFRAIGGFDEEIFLTLEDQILCRDFKLRYGISGNLMPNFFVVHYGNRTVGSLKNFNDIFKRSLSHYMSKY